MITVNSCPFCGDDQVEIDEVRPGEYAVDCLECEAIGPIKPEIMEAIKAWNGSPQKAVNRPLVEAAKELVKRITLDELQLRDTFAYEAFGRQNSFFDDFYRPRIDALNAAIAGAEEA